jgi:alkanesulfonate monooxygenase SsuD/methylene tetrahydromethanopterin reductase-like flavin-dependent oxidoreductase (luciferase family)
MRLGVLILPDRPWTEAQATWRRAEDLGFHHAWTYDHLTWRGLRDSPWHAAIPTLTAAALVTSRIRLGTLVASPHFRHPVAFAKELVTLDSISNGRVIVGIGAGSANEDATVLGVDHRPRPHRAERFEEFVHLLELVLRQPMTTYEGKFFSAHEARRLPACVQEPRVPFAIAATGPRGMRLAARHAAIWVTTGDRRRIGVLPPAQGALEIAAQIERLNEACAEVGRDPVSIRRLVLTGPLLDAGLASPAAFRDAIGRYQEVGVTDLVAHWPRESEPYVGDLATFERAIAGR